MLNSKQTMRAAYYPSWIVLFSQLVQYFWKNQWFGMTLQLHISIKFWLTKKQTTNQTNMQLVLLLNNVLQYFVLLLLLSYQCTIPTRWYVWLILHTKGHTPLNKCSNWNTCKLWLCYTNKMTGLAGLSSTQVWIPLYYLCPPIWGSSSRSFLQDLKTNFIYTFQSNPYAFPVLIIHLKILKAKYEQDVDNTYIWPWNPHLASVNYRNNFCNIYM